MHLARFTTRPLAASSSKTQHRSSTCSSSDEEATRMSLRYTKTCGMSRRMASIMRWKSWPAFLSPNGMNRNLKRPKGVMIAVLWISSGATGIWWWCIPQTGSPCQLGRINVDKALNYQSHMQFHQTNAFLYFI